MKLHFDQQLVEEQLSCSVALAELTNMNVPNYIKASFVWGLHLSPNTMTSFLSDDAGGVNMSSVSWSICI